MGNCNNKGQDKVEKATESVDPPVATVQEDVAPVAAEPELKKGEPGHPAPITVDLHEPSVDVSAPLDERDIDLVQQTFARVAMLGVENVGWVIFMNIFEIAPQAQGLFPTFKDEDPKKLKYSSALKAHAGKVVSTVAVAVSLLRDLPTLVPVLHGLGLKHVGYGVIPAHYDIVGQAVIKSLGTALGDKFTPAVCNAYLKVWTIVKATMLEKCDYSQLTAAPAAAESAKTESKKQGAETEKGAEKKHVDPPSPSRKPTAAKKTENKASE